MAARPLPDSATTLPRARELMRSRSPSVSAIRLAGLVSPLVATERGTSSTGCASSLKTLTGFPVARSTIRLSTIPWRQGSAPVIRVVCPGAVRGLA